MPTNPSTITITDGVNTITLKIVRSMRINSFDVQFGLGYAFATDNNPESVQVELVTRLSPQDISVITAMTSEVTVTNNDPSGLPEIDDGTYYISRVEVRAEVRQGKYREVVIRMVKSL